jgi:phenylacetate-CoA ligase
MNSLIYVVLNKLFKIDPLRADKAMQLYNFIKNSEYWSKNQIEKYQLVKIGKLLRYAVKHVPFYRKYYAEHDVDVEQIKSINDFRSMVPFIDKHIIKANLKDFTSDCVPRKFWTAAATGGSTAEPLNYYLDKRNSMADYVFNRDSWDRINFKFNSKTVMLKGKNIAIPEKNIYFKHDKGYDKIKKVLNLDSCYLGDFEMKKHILPELRRYKPEFIFGYPSSIYQFAKYIETNKNKIDWEIKAVILASENIYDWQRTYFEKVFNTRIFSAYGHSEQVILGAECEYSHYYHYYPQLAFFELIDKKGDQVTKEGGFGEITGTSFFNYVMPFIRYRTQDFGIHTNKRCKCGRNYPMTKRIEGRLQEFIVTKDERLISICTMGAAHFDVLDHVKKIQYYQDSPGKIEFRIVPLSGYVKDDDEKIKNGLNNKFRDSVDFEIVKVPDINTTPRGKHRMMIQKLDVKFEVESN